MFPFIASIAAVLIGGAIVLWVARRKGKPPMAQLASSLGVPEGGPLVVERHGRTFTTKYKPASKSAPPMVRINTPVDETTKPNIFGEGRGFVETRPYIVMRREAASDRFAKRHGLNREIAVGDTEFDSAVYLETNSAEADVQRTLADAGLRKAVRDLIDMDARKVVLGPKGLHTERAVKSKDASDGIDQSMALLAEVAAALPLFRTGQADKPRWLFEAMLTAITLLVFVGLIVLGAGVPAPLGSTAKLVGFGSGVALLPLVMLVATKSLRGRSDSLARIASLAITTLIILPWGSYEALCWVNHEFDTSPGVGRPTKVVRTWTSKSKSRTYYHVDVTSWRPGEEIESLSVSSAFAEKAKAGRAIVVTTHAGRLGWEWVDTFRLAQ